MSSIQKLLEIMAELRNPATGCPWDRQQNFATIAPYTVEEAYEVADAIAREDLDGLRDELGDLLFQVAFHARMAEEQGAFDFEDVARGICDKMVRRHPHVFGTAEERQQGPAKDAWHAIKTAERADKDPNASALDGVAQALPALKRAEKLGKRASIAGFDWPDASGPRAKIEEELGELAEAQADGDPENTIEELGDLLFAVANLARHLKIDPEQALVAANRKFEQRYRVMEQAITASGKAVGDLDIDTLETCWQKAKNS